MIIPADRQAEEDMVLTRIRNGESITHFETIRGMPEIDGFELIARLRKSTDKSIRRIPAAALTAFARSEDRTKALRVVVLRCTSPSRWIPGELASIATLARRVETDSDSH